jgi:hypothetical protein
VAKDIQIVVVEGGWVLVGIAKLSVRQQAIELTNAHVVRRWGTTKGLGEIALSGPTKQTVLDKLGVAFVQLKQVRFTIPCDETKWKL